MKMYVITNGSIWLSDWGKGGATKSDEFSEKFQRGGGGIFNPKKYIADFGNFKQGFWSMKFHTIWPSYLLTYMQPYLSLKKWQHNFPKMRGGGQRPFGIFPKNHPIWRSHPSLTNMQDRRNIAEKHLGGQIPSHRALSSPWYFVSQIICLANSLEIRNYTPDLEKL